MQINAHVSVQIRLAAKQWNNVSMKELNSLKKEKKNKSVFSTIYNKTKHHLQICQNMLCLTNIWRLILK